jgi:hypothetical protein
MKRRGKGVLVILKRDKSFFYGVFFVKGKKPSSLVFLLKGLGKKNKRDGPNRAMIFCGIA